MRKKFHFSYLDKLVFSSPELKILIANNVYLKSVHLSVNISHELGNLFQILAQVRQPWES
jgi:hypothetical protein